jgi:pyruvate ferredoxin oxidoreductase beta subunit
MTAIAIAHHVPYVAQSASSHWDDLSRKAAKAGRADGPAFLNVLTDCPVGWGHEPRISPHVVDAAVETCFWPLYEVENGQYHLDYEPKEKLPVETWLAPQKRFAHLIAPENADALAHVQARLDEEWNRLLELCE